MSVDNAKQWTAEAVEAALASQGVTPGSGRAAKIAAAMNLQKPPDAVRDALPFEVDVTSYAAAVRRSQKP